MAGGHHGGAGTGGGQAWGGCTQGVHRTLHGSRSGLAPGRPLPSPVLPLWGRKRSACELSEGKTEPLSHALCLFLDLRLEVMCAEPQRC